MGTDEFALPILQSIYSSGMHQILGVFTRAPKMQNRGQKNLQNSPVHKLSENLGLQVFCPATLKTGNGFEVLSGLNPDAIIVASYGCIIPKSILDLPKYGCINVHPSLLPRWRGAAPIERAILAGDSKAGVCIMQMDEGVDTGNIFACKTIALDDVITAADLSKELAQIGSGMLLDVLDKLEKHQPSIASNVQSDVGVTYAHKLAKGDGLIDWVKSAYEIHNMVRALNPWPGCFFYYKGEAVKIISADYIKEDVRGDVGEVVSSHPLSIKCKNGVLKPLLLQRPGKAVISAKDFVNGLRLTAGTRLC